jgi:hypothetical protein
MVSPIRILDNDLSSSVFNIAPEKNEKLDAIIKKYSPCLVFNEDKNFKIRVNTGSKEIKLPTVALEYIWCGCYFFYVIYQESCAANSKNEDEFDINGNDRTRNALSLYKWGINQISDNPYQAWPEEQVKPTLDNCSEDIEMTNELYLCAIAWIIHHELAHIYHSHENIPLNDEYSREQEKQADQSATEWILKGVTDKNKLTKRGLGVAIATLLITSQDILAGEFKETTHPKSFKRLYDAVTLYFNDEDHLVYAFSTVICHLNMRLASMDISKSDSETWRENLERCITAFSR